MSDYFILLFLVMILSIIGGVVKDFKIIPKIIFIILILFSGFRFMVGIDFPSYMQIYDYTISDPDHVHVKEIGFLYLIRFLNFLGLEYQSLFLVAALITQVYFYKFLKYFSPMLYISILIYFLIAPYYMSSFNGVRQSIAIAVFAYSLQFIVERKAFKYYIHILFAAFATHATVILMLPLYHVLHKHMTIAKKILVVIASFIGGMFINRVVEISPYVHFLTKSYDDISRNQTVLVFFVISVIIFLTEKYTKDFRHKTIIYNLNLFIVIIIGNALLQSIDILYAVFLRMNNYFFIVYIILIPFLIQMIKNKSLRKLAYLALMVVLCLYYIKTIVLNGEHYHIVPYAIGLDFIK